MENNKMPRVAIVGGGLVGALEACLLARRGYQVTLFEGRHDGRNEEGYFGRSINLAISLRGISALKRLRLENIVEKNAIPMKARMIHGTDGRMKSVQYDPNGLCINSIERAVLNNHLLNYAESQPTVKILFNHRLISLDVSKGELKFEINGETMESYGLFDLIIGCDGAHSSVRSLLMKRARFDFSQTYIEHGYLELRIDPTPDGSYRMPENYLHIWPRGQFMMIALPNKDSSFTCTLFMPNDRFSRIKTSSGAIAFFRKYFPDSIPLIGEDRIKETFERMRPSPLISVKCRPYHYGSKFVIMGDAAHAMVPFYGQGMNCGFEDCLVFDEILDNYDHEFKSPDKSLTQVFGRCLIEFTERRCDNGQAMCDLAMYNYVEMRDLVNSKLFALRKMLDNMLYRVMPNRWIPLYTMVTFSRIPISECIERRQKQDRLLERLGKITVLSLVVGLGAVGAFKYNLTFLDH